MQRQIKDCEWRMDEIWSALMTALEEEDSETTALQLVLKCKSAEQSRDKYIQALITLYENEISNIQVQGPKTWNSIDKHMCQFIQSINVFKAKT